MKLEQAHIDQIRTAFEKMQSREDLLHVLNEAKPLVYGDKAVPFDLKQLTWYANPKLGRKRYAEFKIRKKSGAERCIHAPVKGLKSLQKTLSFVLQCVYEPHNAAMGFVRDRSIVDNAKLHVGSKYVYNIDLKDFFPSVDQARVWKCLQLKPFNLNKASSVEPQYMKWEDFKKEHLKTDEPVTFLKGKGRMFTNTPYGTLYVANNFDKEKDKYILLGSSSLKTKAGKSLEGTLWLVNKIPDTSRLDIANIIASLCCTEMEVERKNETGEWEKVKRNVLPQGAPTSPVITNIVCQKLDYLLSGVAKRFGLKYSRYADDITFSSMHNVYQPESEFLKELHRIIAEQNFHIKESKTRLQKDGYRKEVTGLLVNEKANVQQRYIKQLRMWLYYWERYGYERASGFFLQQYIADKGNVKRGKPDMANVISGKLDYLKMVKGEDNELYLKLRNKFDALTIGNVDKLTKDSETTLLQVSLEKAQKQINSHDEKIKENTGAINSLNAPDNEIKSEKLFIHDPLTTVNLLNKFTEDTKLKYTTHIWDLNTETGEEVINRSTFQDDIEREFRSKYRFPKLQENGLKNLYNTIWNFLIGPNKFGWGRYKLNFGWYNRELNDFYIQNPDKKPGSFIIPEKYLPQSKIDGKYLKYFEDYINVFKKEIEFRGNDLYYLFKKHFEFGFEFKIEIDDALKGVSFYTDTKLINEAIELIADNIKQRSAKDRHIKITFLYNSEGRFNEIKIINVDSYSNSPLTNDKLTLRNERGQLKTIREKLRNLCDFSIESTFNDSGKTLALELIYLSKERREFSEAESQFIKNPIVNAEGFVYKLKFYE